MQVHNYNKYYSSMLKSTKTDFRINLNKYSSLRPKQHNYSKSLLSTSPRPVQAVQNVADISETIVNSSMMGNKTIQNIYCLNQRTVKLYNRNLQFYKLNEQKLLRSIENEMREKNYMYRNKIICSILNTSNSNSNGHATSRFGHNSNNYSRNNKNNNSNSNNDSTNASCNSNINTINRGVDSYHKIDSKNQIRTNSRNSHRNRNSHNNTLTHRHRNSHRNLNMNTNTTINTPKKTSKSKLHNSSPEPRMQPSLLIHEKTNQQKLQQQLQLINKYMEELYEKKRIKEIQVISENLKQEQNVIAEKVSMSELETVHSYLECIQCKSNICSDFIGEYQSICLKFGTNQPYLKTHVRIRNMIDLSRDDLRNYFTNKRMQANDSQVIYSPQDPNQNKDDTKIVNNSNINISNCNNNSSNYNNTKSNTNINNNNSNYNFVNSSKCIHSNNYIIRVKDNT